MSSFKLLNLDIDEEDIPPRTAADLARLTAEERWRIGEGEDPPPGTRWCGNELWTDEELEALDRQLDPEEYGGQRHIGCDIDGFAYDRKWKKGKLYVPEGQCCDPMGCIAWFQHHFHKGVRRIETYSGDTLDATFFRDGNEWRTICHWNGGRVRS